MIKEIYFGLDLGSKTCGLAVSDGLGMFAHPVTTLQFKPNDYETCIELLKPWVEKYQVKGFVLGFPKSLNNSISQRAQITLEFKELLEEVFHLTVELIDERFTTAASHKMLISMNKKRNQRKEIIDQAAAVEILQTYLDQLRFKNGK